MSMSVNSWFQRLNQTSMDKYIRCEALNLWQLSILDWEIGMCLKMRVARSKQTFLFNYISKTRKMSWYKPNVQLLENWKFIIFVFLSLGVGGKPNVHCGAHTCLTCSTCNTPFYHLLVRVWILSTLKKKWKVFSNIFPLSVIACVWNWFELIQIIRFKTRSVFQPPTHTPTNMLSPSTLFQM